MTTALIDDEPAAINDLRRMIGEYCPSLSVVGTATSVAAGLELIGERNPELIFLDIQMPGGSGFDLIHRLAPDRRPEIIFATSQEAYALEAIQCAALGYLLKPVELTKLLRAVELARQRIAEKTSGRRLEALIRNLQHPGATTNTIGVPSTSGVDFVEVGNITHCEGTDRCTRIHLTNGKSLLSSYNLGEFRRSLQAYNFLAVHRSFLVNNQHIRRYDNAGTLQLSSGASVPVSRRRRQEVLDRLAGR